MFVDSCGEENRNHPVAGAITALKEAPSVPLLPFTEKTLDSAFPASQLSELRGSGEACVTSTGGCGKPGPFCYAVT